MFIKYLFVYKTPTKLYTHYTYFVFNSKNINFFDNKIKYKLQANKSLKSQFHTLECHQIYTILKKKKTRKLKIYTYHTCNL